MQTQRSAVVARKAQQLENSGVCLNRSCHLICCLGCCRSISTGLGFNSTNRQLKAFGHDLLPVQVYVVACVEFTEASTRSLCANRGKIFWLSSPSGSQELNWRASVFSQPCSLQSSYFCLENQKEGNKMNKNNIKIMKALLSFSILLSFSSLLSLLSLLFLSPLSSLSFVLSSFVPRFIECTVYM